MEIERTLDKTTIPNEESDPDPGSNDEWDEDDGSLTASNLPN